MVAVEFTRMHLSCRAFFLPQTYLGEHASIPLSKIFGPVKFLVWEEDNFVLLAINCLCMTAYISCFMWSEIEASVQGRGYVTDYSPQPIILM